MSLLSCSLLKGKKQHQQNQQQRTKQNKKLELVAWKLLILYEDFPFSFTWALLAILLIIAWCTKLQRPLLLPLYMPNINVCLLSLSLTAGLKTSSCPKGHAEEAHYFKQRGSEIFKGSYHSDSCLTSTNSIPQVEAILGDLQMCCLGPQWLEESD